LEELVAQVNLSKIKKSKKATAQRISFTVHAVALGVAGIYAILR
jgi:hypothetical protein